MITDRIDAITKISSAYLSEECPPPKSVKIEITATCNYRCNFCTKSLHDTEDGHMDRALYSRLIREMRDAGVEELGVFYIGESFTCKWLPEAIKEAKDVGFPYVFLTTNGSAATPDRVRKCMEAGLDSLKFSLNFHSPGQLASVAQVDERYFHKAIENLKAAKKIRDEGGFKCGLYASSIKFDGKQGEAMERIVDEILPFVNEHYWLPLFQMNGAAQAAGWKPGAGNPGRLGAMRDPLPCWATMMEGHIDKDGNMIACCFGDVSGGGLNMGNLNNAGFMEIWNGEKYRALRAAHLRKDVSGTACEACIAA